MFCQSLALGLLGSRVLYALKEPILWSNDVDRKKKTKSEMCQGVEQQVPLKFTFMK